MYHIWYDEDMITSIQAAISVLGRSLKPHLSGGGCVSIIAVFLLLHGVVGAQTHQMPLVRLEGVEDSSLRELLEGLSPALWQSPRPPESEAILRGRARRHQERLVQALTSEGYYAGSIDFSIQWTAAPPQVIFKVTTGPVYRIDQVAVRIWQEADTVQQPELEPPVRIQPRLRPGATGRAEDVIDAERAIIGQLNHSGYPFAQVFDRQVTVTHDTRTLDVVYYVASGPRMRFGPPRITGLRDVQPETLRREFSWFEGAWYDERLLQETQRKLQQTGLFSLVRVGAAPVDAAEDDLLPVDIEVTERRHRTVSVGLKYRTDEGIGAGASWEHRNFMNLGQRLRVQSQLTELEQNFSVDYEIKEFMQTRDTLTLQAKVAQINPDPYRSRRIDIGAWLEHSISEDWTLGFGPALRLSEVEERRRWQRYDLISFPVQVSLDRRDDRMNPEKGYRATNRFTPFMDVRNVDVFFLKNELTLSHFLPLGADSGFTLATRLRLGLTGGASLSEIPADERFYAGGGGSIRGYAYQTVGPLNKDGDPTGGRSITDWSIELRKRINDPFGVVAFVDGGMAHETPYFNFNDAPQWGAGLGFRYFTPIGPVRLDVAVPLNRRKGIDSSVQFYVSIGQAF